MFVDPILGHLVAIRGKGQNMITQECAASIPREPVHTEDTQRQLGTVTPFRMTSSVSPEERPGFQLHLKGLIISRNLDSLESVHIFLIAQKSWCQE